MRKVEDELEHQDAEVERLRKLLEESSRGIYHADKYDKVDSALGTILN